MLGIPNIKILWGDLIITELFDVIGFDDPPSEAVFDYKQENMANGKARTIASANNEISYGITVNRDVSDNSNFKILEEEFDKISKKRLRIVKEDGTILLDYKSAILANKKFKMGSVEDAKGVDIKITWSVSNG